MHQDENQCVVDVPESDPVSESPEQAILAAQDALDPCTKALYACDIQVRELNISIGKFYLRQQRTDPRLDASAPLLAHMDGGSMISTTNRIDMLYSVRKLSPRESSSISIRVADDSVHHLQSVGYLRVPLHVGTNRFGSEFVQTFYTQILSVSTVN